MVDRRSKVGIEREEHGLHHKRESIMAAKRRNGRARTGTVKALVWFWIIDETYALTFVMSDDMS